MEICRVICDSKSLLAEIYEKWSVLVRLEEAKIFLNAVRSITESVATVDDENLINHYQMFVAHVKALLILQKNWSFDIRQ